MSIKLQTKGFESLLEAIQEAQGDLERVTKACLRKSADIMQQELKTEMRASKVDDGLIAAMPTPEITQEGNEFTARVGYRKGAYNPNNISDGYKVVFLNYGTPRRTKHGKIAARGFIQRAKAAAQPKIRKEQRATLKRILSGLQNR